METWAKWQLFKEFAGLVILGVLFIASLMWCLIDCIRNAIKKKKEKSKGR